jgi:hypothetical protein
MSNNRKAKRICSTNLITLDIHWNYNRVHNTVIDKIFIRNSNHERKV